MKKSYIFLANGFEEIEGLTVVDLLRRAELPIEMVSITGQKEVMGSHQIQVTADSLFDAAEYTDAAALIIPGGMPGTIHLQEFAPLGAVLKQQKEREGIVAAICAAPSVLGGLGLLADRKACCHPGFEENCIGADVQFVPVVTDGNIITSRGMGTAIDFSLALITALSGKEAAEQVKKGIVYQEIQK